MTEPTAQTPAPGSHPHDPAMAAPDAEMFGSLNRDENAILRTHLTSGWYKQSAIYPQLSEPWRETSAVLDDLNAAWWASWHAEHDAEAGS